MPRLRDQIINNKQQLRRDMAGLTLEEQVEYMINRTVGAELILERSEKKVRDLAIVNKVLREDVYSDELTKISNLRYLNLVAPAMMEAATPDKPSKSKKRTNALVAVFIDVNGLGAINKQFGDDFGDELICTAATALRKHFRRATDLIARSDEKENVVARKGGDELILLLPDTSIEFVEATMEELNRSTYSEFNGHRIDVKCSFGCAVYTGQKDFTEMRVEADRAMRAYKSTAPKSTVTDITSVPRVA